MDGGSSLEKGCQPHFVELPLGMPQFKEPQTKATDSEAFAKRAIDDADCWKQILLRV